MQQFWGKSISIENGKYLWVCYEYIPICHIYILIKITDTI